MCFFPTLFLVESTKELCKLVGGRGEETLQSVPSEVNSAAWQKKTKGNQKKRLLRLVISGRLKINRAIYNQ